MGNCVGTGMECQYCKHYKYDSDLTRVFWKLTQNENERVPKIGRCTFGGREYEYGNAVLSGGIFSDAAKGCENFEHRGTRKELKYRRYDTFVYKGGEEECICWIESIQYEYSPCLYRLYTEVGGAWSASEEDLSDSSKYQIMWRLKEEIK